MQTVETILRVIFHIEYDSNESADIDINDKSGFWYCEDRIVALIFILISGMSSGFGKTSFKRGGKVLALGMGITINI